MNTVLRSLALAALPILVQALAYSPLHLEKRQNNVTAASVSAELGPQLSTNSLIFGSDDDRWDNATVRWQASYEPDFFVVVEPATEEDIPVIASLTNVRLIQALPANDSPRSNTPTRETFLSWL